MNFNVAEDNLYAAYGREAFNNILLRRRIAALEAALAEAQKKPTKSKKKD